MASFGGSTGFTLLIWIDDDTWRLEGLVGQQRDDKKRELLQDAITLLCGRWGMEGTFMETGGNSYAFFTCSRFVISTATLTRALGNLAGAVKFHRGSPTDKPELLIAYKECLAKYEVPEKVSEGSFGEGYAESQSGATWAKRPRKS